MNKFAERIRYVRLEKEMSRKELAEKLNVSARLISSWECGQRQCTLDMLLRLSEIFEVSTDFLLGKTDY